MDKDVWLARADADRRADPHGSRTPPEVQKSGVTLPSTGSCHPASPSVPLSRLAAESGGQRAEYGVYGAHRGTGHPYLPGTGRRRRGSSGAVFHL